MLEEYSKLITADLPIAVRRGNAKASRWPLITNVPPASRLALLAHILAANLSSWRARFDAPSPAMMRMRALRDS
jgi:hypothetical protein